MAELINVKDTLNDGRIKLNEGIKASERAEEKSDNAVRIANEKGNTAIDTAQRAESKSDSTQTQLDTIVIEGDSSVEAAQARVDTKGDAHANLKARLDDEYTEVTSELAKKAKKVDLDEAVQQIKAIEQDFERSYLFDKIYGTFSLYNKPSGFPLTIPFEIYTSPSGKVQHTYDVSVNKNKVTKRYYVDVKFGDNTNPGTESQPFKEIGRALRYGDADEIIVKDGVYGWTTGYNAYNQTKSYNLIGVGDVFVGAHRDNLTWSPHATLPNVYQTNATAVIEIIDIKSYEQPEFLNKQDNVQSVNDNRNSYYIDSSNNIYVRTIDDRKPDDYVLCNMANNAASGTNLDNIYCENIKFVNTVDIAATTNGNAKFHAKNCDFFFGTDSNSLYLKGVDFIIQNCRAKYATRDGFNYHVNNGVISKGIEIDCEGSYNGRDGGNSNNGSTMHDGGSILRINGEYHHNHGPNVIDVNPGTKSLNIGVHAHHSTATASVSNADFRTRDADMWLVNCVSHDSEYATSKEGNASLYKENSLLLGEEFVA